MVDAGGSPVAESYVTDGGGRHHPSSTGHESRPVEVPPTLTTFWSLTEAKTVGLFSV